MQPPPAVQKSEAEFKAQKAETALAAQKKRVSEEKKKAQAEREAKALRRQEKLAAKSLQLVANQNKMASKVSCIQSGARTVRRREEKG